MTERSLAECASIAARVAKDAGKLLAGGYRSRPAATLKGKADVVTEFDLASEALIRERLSRETPEIALVGEEGGGTAGAGRTWYCDPLDGTTNYLHGHPFWAVSIGLMERGVPLAGAVVAPVLNVAWVGHRDPSGAEALRNDVPCAVSDTATLADALLATGFPPNRSVAPANNFESFTRVKPNVQGIRRCGSAALDLCLVADGTYDAYWERRLNPWDCVAGAAILLAAGGTLTALDGGPVDLTIGHLIASNGKIHSELQALLK